MSTAPVSSPQDPQSNDSRYGQLFKVLADLLLDFQEFFSVKRSEKGIELSEQGRVSEVVIVSCSPEELILSGAVLDKRTRAVTVTISVTGNLSGFEICTLCDCRTNRYCEHAAAILESFFDEVLELKSLRMESRTLARTWYSLVSYSPILLVGFPLNTVASLIYRLSISSDACPECLCTSSGSTPA
jgi:hypothetical protein